MELSVRDAAGVKLTSRTVLQCSRFRPQIMTSLARRFPALTAPPCAQLCGGVAMLTGQQLTTAITDLVTVVRLAHGAKLCEVVIKRIALASGQVIVVYDVLDASNRLVEFALIESSPIPLLREVAKVVLGVIETLPVSMRDMPSSVSAIQVSVHAIDDGGNGTGVIDPPWPVLCLRKTSESQKRGYSSKQMLSHGISSLLTMMTQTASGDPALTKI